MNQELYPEFPVLVVDDEEHFLNSMKITLKANNIINVECCQDSGKVIALIEKKKFSIILLDILMPGMRGDELLTRIIESYPEIPVIMRTAVNKVETADKCMKLSAFDYLVKPLETPQLLKSIRKTLD